MSKIGINTLSINNDFNLLNEVKSLLDTFECSKRFYLENHNRIGKLNLECTVFSSLILGDYDISTFQGRKDFLNEYNETILMAKDLGVTKFMFGLSRFRRLKSTDTISFFKELIEYTKIHDIKLMYEAISPKLYANDFLKNHKELQEFSKECNLDYIHFDYGTARAENEQITDVDLKIINVHYPFEPINIPYDVSFEGSNITKEFLINFLNGIRR